MLELLQRCWDFVWSVGGEVVGLAERVGVLAWELLVLLHMSNPRLEGLLVGVALAWLLSRKDKHPFLRAASAPLNLILNILDLAWDQVVEFFEDVWGTVSGWVKGGWNWCKSKVVGCWNWGLNCLGAVSDRLKREEGQE